MAAVAALRAQLAELWRRPTAVVLMVVLPPLVIEMYGTALTSFPPLPGLGGTDPATAGRRTGALFAVSFLAGLVGLFTVISSRRGDRRLLVCGFPRFTLLLGRVAGLASVVVVSAALALAVLGWRIDVAAPIGAWAVLVLAGSLYGLLGLAVGTLLPRDLEGSLVLVFVADLDNALSSELFDAGAAGAWMPLHHPHRLFTAAVADGTFAAGHLAPALAWLASAGLVAAGVHHVAARGS